MRTSELLHTFNRETALDRVGGDDELLREVVELYLSEYPGLLVQIEGAVRAQDAFRLQHAAHTLKGSLATLGAEAAAHQALELEIMARNENLRGAPATLSRLLDALDGFHGELGRFTRS